MVFSGLSPVRPGAHEATAKSNQRSRVTFPSLVKWYCDCFRMDRSDRNFQRRK
jgi:hypothetical protein